MEDHQIAAHHVARHLRAIATLLPYLSAQGADPLYAILAADKWQKQVIEDAATMIEATAPFEPVQAEMKDAMRAYFAEQLADRSTREVVDDYCGDWTEAEWRAEYAEYADFIDFTELMEQDQ